MGSAVEASGAFVVGEVEGSGLGLVDICMGGDSIQVPADESGGVAKAVAAGEGFCFDAAVEIPC